MPTWDREGLVHARKASKEEQARPSTANIHIALPFVLPWLQSKAYADAEDAEFQLGADLEERGGTVQESQQSSM